MSKKEFFIPLCLLVLLVLGARAFANSDGWRHGETQHEDPKILISGIMHSAVLELRSDEEVDPHELVERILMPHVDVL